jgi:hypothetical protein
MMTTRKILNLLTFAMCISAVLAASANAKDLDKLLSGTYASTNSSSCIFTSADAFGTFFDENLAIQPIGSDSHPAWGSLSTTVTYNGDGTGSEVGTGVSINNEGGASVEINCDLTYVVNSDESFEVTRQCNNMIGPQPFSAESVEDGQIQRGGDVLITTSAEARVEMIELFGFHIQAICARSGTEVKVKDK